MQDQPAFCHDLGEQVLAMTVDTAETPADKMFLQVFSGDSFQKCGGYVLHRLNFLMKGSRLKITTENFYIRQLRHHPFFLADNGKITSLSGRGRFDPEFRFPVQRVWLVSAPGASLFS